jgi:hypothetical protein
MEAESMAVINGDDKPNLKRKQQGRVQGRSMVFAPADAAKLKCEAAARGSSTWGPPLRPSYGRNKRQSLAFSAAFLGFALPSGDRIAIQRDRRHDE